tara:strand:+ start:3696 stop:4616 length:921 start_codon:yes stop_codon:yes gene_type:complete
MNTEDKTNQIAIFFSELHKNLYSKIKAHEKPDCFIEDEWKKESLGGGISVVVDQGHFFDKAGINFSRISGSSLPESSVGSNDSSTDMPFFATGVSVVFHPKNPNIPTAHLNVRYFCTFKDGKIFEEWFGGGFDLTPYILYEKDCINWHKAAKKACDSFDKELYVSLKAQCDQYFYIKHRKEHRGIGGIFYEKLKPDTFEHGLDLSKKVCEAFINSYTEIIDKRKGLEFTEREKEFQKFRRGRYVEFNLVYDRGTLFGLQTGGRIESILMSLPSDVSWRYKFDESLTESERNLYTVIKKPKDWINDT